MFVRMICVVKCLSISNAYLGISNLGVGLLCAGMACYIADRTQLHGPILATCCFITSIGVFLVYFSLVNGMLGLMYAANALTGMGLFATIPISMELAVEVTFPVCEGSGFANVPSLVLTYMLL